MKRVLKLVTGYPCNDYNSCTVYILPEETKKERKRKKMAIKQCIKRRKGNICIKEVTRLNREEYLNDRLNGVTDLCIFLESNPQLVLQDKLENLINELKELVDTLIEEDLDIYNEVALQLYDQHREVIIVG